jgi:hypothetical protein
MTNIGQHIPATSAAQDALASARRSSRRSGPKTVDELAMGPYRWPTETLIQQLIPVLLMIRQAVCRVKQDAIGNGTCTGRDERMKRK